jgi:hypothetical protein
VHAQIQKPGLWDDRKEWKGGKLAVVLVVAAAAMKCVFCTDFSEKMEFYYAIFSVVEHLTLFNEVFSGNQPHQVSVLNHHFKDHLSLL